MSAFDVLKGWPGISDAPAEELFAHPAWAMPCQWGDERCSLRRAAAKPRDVIGIAITLDDDPHFLGLGNRETFPDLHDLWARKAELPPALILALIEKECGDLLQMIENVARRQVGVTGLDDPEKRSGAIAFEVRTPETRIITDPETALRIKTKKIDGVTYILVPAGESVSVNGVDISTKASE